MEILPTEKHADVLLLAKTTRWRLSVHNDEMGDKSQVGEEEGGKGP